MESNKARRIILLILALIAIYVWVQNMDLFVGESSYFRLAPESKKKLREGKIKKGTPEYIEPKINPFGNEIQSHGHTAPSNRTLDEIPSQETYPSREYTLEGIVGGTKRPQAILRSQSSENKIVAINDSLNEWRTLKISKNLVIFGKGKIRDSLKLEDK
jgi:hypothetical protein